MMLIKHSIDLKVDIAHDYQCPWCWVSVYQAEELAMDYPQLRLEWTGYELLPNRDDWPDTRPAPSGRFEELVKSANLKLPTSWPPIVNTKLALISADRVQKMHPDKFAIYNKEVYRAFWERNEDISDRAVLAACALRANLSGDIIGIPHDLGESATRLKEFSRDAVLDGITHLTTFRFRGEQCAEAPYSTIADLTERFVNWYG